MLKPNDIQILGEICLQLFFDEVLEVVAKEPLAMSPKDKMVIKKLYCLMFKLIASKGRGRNEEEMAKPATRLMEQCMHIIKSHDQALQPRAVINDFITDIFRKISK